MSERAREIAQDARRCGCCDRAQETCSADPCDEVRESMAGAYVCDSCGRREEACAAAPCEEVRDSRAALGGGQ